MLRNLKQFFEKYVEPGFGAGDPDEVDHAVRLSTAVMLVEVARADSEFDPSERDVIANVLQKTQLVSVSEAQELLRLAEAEVDAAVSLYDFIKVLNNNLTLEQKRSIIELLWEVAFADGKLDKYEDYSIRRLADLLYVPHTHFIQAKLRVQQRNG
jgi:uncharacterized tellurite resistance protein B-like protein